MWILEELKTLLDRLDIPSETGKWSDMHVDTYAVIIPDDDEPVLHTDDRIGGIIENARISLFAKNNYIKIKNSLLHALDKADLTINSAGYIGYENETGYHHYAVDVSKFYGEWD